MENGTQKKILFLLGCKKVNRICYLKKFRLGEKSETKLAERLLLLIFLHAELVCETDLMHFLLYFQPGIEDRNNSHTTYGCAKSFLEVKFRNCKERVFK